MFSISGLDTLGAETFVHLVTGATLPDSGDVSLFGRNTRAITDGEAWLKSLDGVGMITARGILIEAFTVLQNIALSLTLEVDPIDPRVMPAGRRPGARRRDCRRPVRRAGREKRAPDIKMRVHLARALALEPKLLIAEHPSAALPRESVAGIWRRPRQRGALAGPRAARDDGG